MAVRFSQLQCKEVICLGDGRRLGFIEDVEIELPEGRVCAIIVPGPCKVFGIAGRKDDYVIPWRCVRRIGPDIVLVDVNCEECLVPRHKPGCLF